MDLPATLKKGELQLVGIDSNAFAVMGAVNKALRRAGNTKEDMDAVRDAMMSGDYDNLLFIAMEVTESPEEDTEAEYEDDYDTEDDYDD